VDAQRYAASCELHRRTVAYVGVPQRIGAVGLPSQPQASVAYPEYGPVEAVLIALAAQSGESHGAFCKFPCDHERVQNQCYARSRMLATDCKRQVTRLGGELACLACVGAASRGCGA
jgi:hypothetical protein